MAFPSAGVRGSPTSGSLPVGGSIAYAAELGVLAAKRLTASDSPRIPWRLHSSWPTKLGHLLAQSPPDRRFRPLRAAGARHRLPS